MSTLESQKPILSGVEDGACFVDGKTGCTRESTS